MISRAKINAYLRVFCGSVRGSIADEIDGASIPSEPAFFTTPSVLRKDLEIKRMSALKQGVQFFGVAEAISTLAGMNESRRLQVNAVRANAWTGFVVSEVESETIICCAFAKRRSPALETPPAWDGSLAMLEKFNQSLRDNP